MPNHITNIVTFNGEDKDIKAIMKLLSDGKGGITFNNFSPMPKELVNSSSPIKIVTKKELDKLKILRDEKEANGTLNDWNGKLPITAKTQSRLIEEYGFDNWYDWAIANWGTKWGAYDGTVISDNEVSFDSAWDTPTNAMTSLSAKFPNVMIVVRYADEDFGHNVGEYTLVSGMEMNSNVPLGGSEQAIRMALDIKNMDGHYLGEQISEMRKEDLTEVISGNEDYYSTLLKVIFENEIIQDDYPEFIIQFLLDQAVENEQFEYAHELSQVLLLNKV